MSSVEKKSVIITNTDFRKEADFNDSNFQLYLHQTIESSFPIDHVKGSLFFFLQKGTAEIKTKNFSALLTGGMYVGLQEMGSITLAPHSVGISVKVTNISILNTIGGPVEVIGRLKYIDGCSDTLLISPSRLGEPCLNLLHFPANTKQTTHHHPSFRFGIVISGNGYCDSDGMVKQLAAGDVFYIPSLIKHSFNTESECLNIIAFHPDSDWGPTDEVHPMINKTII